MPIEPRVVVITGASEGIGAALAERLAADGCRLALVSRRRDKLDEVANRAQAAGSPRAIAIPTDVRDRGAVGRLADATIDSFGHFDVWVNNAGRGILRHVLDLTDADVDEMMAVNLKSAIYGMQTAIPHFMSRGTGHLINISSMLGRVPVAAYRSAYNAAKAALNALTTNLRADLRQSHPGIHVSLVLPGTVATAFAQHVLGVIDESPRGWSS